MIGVLVRAHLYLESRLCISCLSNGSTYHRPCISPHTLEIISKIDRGACHSFHRPVFSWPGTLHRVEWLLYSGHILTYGHKLTFHINMQYQFSSIALLVK